MYDPWSARRMRITRSAISSPDDDPIRTIASLGVAIAAVVVVVIVDMGGGEWDVGVGGNLCCVL
jgi:hypothetical protein